MSPAPHRVAHYRLVVGPRPDPDRIFFHNIWSKGHNSPQSEGLLPRLRRIDAYLLMCSRFWAVRAVQFRLFTAAGPVRNRRVVAQAATRYRWMLAHGPEQIPHFAGQVVAQIDDPVFTAREAELLSSPNVAVCVLTAESAVRRFEVMGVRRPFYVFPLGSELETLTEGAVAAVRDRWRRPGELVAGYMASTLRLPGDRYADNPLHNVEHLLDLWDQVHGRVPKSRLWLIGEASKRLRARVAGRDDILLFGTIGRTRSLPYVANFDVALYPRTADQGVRASKIADYLAAGVPIVSYDYAVVDDVREAGAGILAETPDDFVGAVERLFDDEGERRRLAGLARLAGAERDWRILAPRFERDVLDRYLA